MIYQHSTMGALMSGALAGTMRIGDLLTHGNLGIGTLADLDGEVIILDGEAYHADASGQFRRISDDEMTPYATVTPFEPDRIFGVEDHLNFHHMADALVSHMRSKELFSAIKITGQFKKMRVRMIPKQQPPYGRLIESAKNQPEFEQNDVHGTIVGFYTPELFQGVSVSGFHLHFIDDDRTFGGHVLDFDITGALVELSDAENVEIHFPKHDENYLNTTIDYATLNDDIQYSE